MGGQWTRKQTAWAVIIGATLAWSSVGDIALTPQHAVSAELPPVVIGALVGFVAGLAWHTLAARLRSWPRLIDFRSSLRWRGRPHFVDGLAFVVLYVVAMQLIQRLQAHHVAHLGELGLGLLDGIAIAVAIDAVHGSVGVGPRAT